MTVAEVTDWMQHGSCRSHPADWWFPEHGNGLGEQAKTVCQTCPVQAPCLDYALTRKEEGVWGGLTSTERRALLRNTARALQPRSPIVHGTERGYKAHRRRGEQACADCSQAASEARRRRSAA